MKIEIDVSQYETVMLDAFRWLLYENRRFIILRGGAGSGKSHSAAQTILYRILRDFDRRDKHKVLCLRKTLPAAKKSLLPLFRHYINKYGLDKLVTLNKSEGIFNFVNGSEIHVSSLDDPEKVKSFEGLTSVLLEEANSFTAQDFRQLNLRLRGQTSIPFQLFLPFNPCEKGWIFDEFFREQNDQVVTHLSTYKDNSFLDDGYRRTLEELINRDQNYYKIYTLGEWGSLGNQIYNNFEIIDKIPKNVIQHDDVCYGVDFGYAVESGIVKCFRYEDGIYLQECLYATKYTTSDLIAFFKKLKWFDTSNFIYADAAEPDRIEEMERQGLNVIPAAKGQGSVLAGIDFLKAQKLYITSDSVNLIDEIEKYKFREDKDGNTIEQPVKFKDHLCLVGSTLITTLRGDVPIKDVNTSDYVLTRAGYKRVIEAGCTGVKTVKDFGVLTGTPDHRVITKDGKVEIQNVKPSHTLYQLKEALCLNTECLRSTDIVKPFVAQTVVRQSSDGRKEEVYNLTIEDQHEYFANGLLVSNCDAMRYASFTHWGKNAVPKLYFG